MSRTPFLLVALIVIAIAIWMITQGGERGDAAAANPVAELEEPRDRGRADLIALEGEEGDPGARVEVPAEPQMKLDSLVARDGEESTADVEGSDPIVSSARVWLVGRIVDAAGSPVAERELPTRFQVHRGMFGPTHFAGAVTTDANGRFRQDIDDEWLEEGTPMTLEVVDSKSLTGDAAIVPAVHTEGPCPAAERASFVVPSFLGDGEHDLGEAEVRGPLVLASGHVLDGRGGTVEGAEVSVRWKHPVTVPPGADPERYLSDMWWMLDGARTHSSAAGAFELTGFVPDVTLRIEARKPGYLDAEPVECAIGSMGVDVTLLLGGGIAGRVLFDEGIPLDRFQVEVRVGEGMAGYRVLNLDREGGFEAEGLPPGQGLVSLVLKQDRDTLLEIDAVDVSSSPTYRDPRLDPLDLRGAVTAASLTIVGPDGELLPSAEGRVVGMRFPDTSSREFMPRDDPGVLEFLGLGDGLDIEVWATGYCARVVTGVRGDVRVQLEPGTTIRVELASAPPLEKGESLQVMLEVHDEYWQPVAAVPIEPGGLAELVASHRGRHQFSLWLAISAPERAGRLRIQSTEAAPGFEVVQDEDPGTQTIVLTEAALAAAREDWERFR